MRTLPVRLIAFIALTGMPASMLRGDDSAYAQLLKEREGVLSQILAQEESRHGMGVCGEEPVLAAKLALLSFRRDAAATPAEKLKHQEAIVALYQRRLDLLAAHATTGAVEPLVVLRATDALLAEKLTLEKLTADKR